MAGHKGTTHTLGTCAICWSPNITSYHYRKAHGLIPKELFTYGEKMWRCQKHMVKTPDPHKIMRHYWLEHAHSYYKKLPYKTRKPYYSKGTPPNLSEKWLTLEEKPVSIKPALKTAEDIDSNQYKETPVNIIPSAAIPNQEVISRGVAHTSDNPPITAEAIVNAFEKRVIQIDAQLEAKDKLISQKANIIDANNETIFALNKALVLKEKLIDEQMKRLNETTKELNAVKSELLNRKPLEEPTPTKTDGLVGRLFKR